MTRQVLYLHGFASSPDGAKATALRERLEPGVVLLRPDLTVPSFRFLDFERIVDCVETVAAANSPVAIVGSSLGSLVALSLVRRGLELPLVLIAPALGIADRWREKTPPGDPVSVFHHGASRELPIHRAFFERMMTLDVDAEAPRVRVTAFMGTLDESVPLDCVERRWREWEVSGRLHTDSRLIVINGGDHGLVQHVPQIAEAIVDSLT